jgi:multiple sugar transport system substrate-binding protein
MLIGCGVDLASPPRLATATARAAASPTAEPPPLVLSAPTATASASGSPSPISGTSLAEVEPVAAFDAEKLTVWINEVSPEHQRVLDEMATDFADRHGIDVAIQLVSPALLPDLVNTGILSGTLPDLVLHPVEFTAGWAEGGILDPAAANEVVDRLGRDTFDPAALELLAVGGQTAAIPSDGFHQLILYRSDWFEERSLRVPDTFAALATAAEAIFDREAIISGLVIPTESNLVTTHQAFEQIALANGCRLIDETGEVKILEPACHEAIEHYFMTINRFSPSGVQTDTSARNALLDGRTAIIMTSPAILPDLAGLNPAAMPGCAECEQDDDGVNYLARNTGILTEIRGPSGEPTAFGNMTVLGITTAADRAAAQAFAEYWFEEGYQRWLAVNPERKVPMRLGTTGEPRAYIDAWGSSPLGASGMSLTDIYGAEIVATLRDGIASAPRWGVREGFGGLMTQLYDEFIISIVLQEMLSGYFGTETTLNEAYRRTVELIPNYAFPFLLEEEELAP